jgi:hypothetical protein
MITEIAKRAFLGAFTMIVVALVGYTIVQLTLLAPTIVIAIVATMAFFFFSFIVGVLIYPDDGNE